MSESISYVGIVRMRTGSPAVSGDQRAERGPPILYAVDDDVATLDLLCEVARDRGWLTRRFTHLAPFERALRQRAPTLVVLDDELPDGRGGDLARELRRDPSTADIALLVCTAVHPIRQAEIGAWAPVVAKPFHLDEIERFLEAAWRRHHGGARLDEAG